MINEEEKDQFKKDIGRLVAFIACICRPSGPGVTMAALLSFMTAIISNVVKPEGQDEICDQMAEHFKDLKKKIKEKSWEKQ